MIKLLYGDPRENESDLHRSVIRFRIRPLYFAFANLSFFNEIPTATSGRKVLRVCRYYVYRTTASYTYLDCVVFFMDSF